MIRVVAKTIARKKNIETVKEKILNSLRESDTVEERYFNIQNMINQREVIEAIKHYEDIIKIGNKKNILGNKRTNAEKNLRRELKFVITLF